MNKKNFLILSLIVFSFIIVVYQLKFSESARIKNNLKDFSKIEDFFTNEVSKEDIEEIKRKDLSYSFTILKQKDIKQAKKLGKVYILDKTGNKFNSFILFNNDDKYIVYMRNIYMSID